MWLARIIHSLAQHMQAPGTLFTVNVGYDVGKIAARTRGILEK